jgi:hypothetical protein
MKKFALAVLSALLLAACPMTGGTPPTTPTPADPTTPNQPTGCLCTEKLNGAGPAVQPWQGDLPEPRNGTGWVLQKFDEEQWLLTLIELDKKEVLVSYHLTAQQERRDAVSKIADQQVDWPQILFAVLGGLRPIPQPGPPGEPGDHWNRGLNALLGMRWAELNDLPGEPGKVSSPTHGN